MTTESQHRPIVVQKYGGSSLADAELIHNVASRISARKDEGVDVIAVVSAMGDSTDELIALSEAVTGGKTPDAREMDTLLSTGELVSSTLMAMALKSRGYDAISLSGVQAGIKTDLVHGSARIADINADRLHRELDAGRIVIVAGFQGLADSGDITTLGRGGSDTTAVALAIAAGAERCEIYTDVEGIYTTDPRLTPKARKLAEIGFQEMLEMAVLGAKMNPRSIEHTENNELYGSVKPTEISKLIQEENKIDIKPSMIQPVEEIKALGKFKVKISLHSEVDAEIKINVSSADTIQ